MAAADASAERAALAILTIDLAAIAANYRMLTAKAAPAECAGVVKADAYGLGRRQGGAGAVASRMPHFLRRHA